MQRTVDPAEAAALEPLVSVLMPTYCRADLLPLAIRSALAQTHSRTEVLILDNASPDDGRTTRAVQPFLDADARVRYVRHPRNLGITGNWRAGIAAAQGDYFCLLHDDDTYEPSFLAELLAAIGGDTEVVLAFCDHWVTDSAGRRDPELTERVTRMFGRDRLAAGPLADFAHAALVDNAISAGATLFRRADTPPEFIDDAAQGSIDIWLLYGCVTTGKRAVYVPQRLMNYRSHAGGMSASQPRYMTEGHLWRYDRMLADPRVAAIHPALAGRRAATWANYAILLLGEGRRADAAAALRQAHGPTAIIGHLLVALGPLGPTLVRSRRQLRRLLRTTLRRRRP